MKKIILFIMAVSVAILLCNCEKPLPPPDDDDDNNGTISKVEIRYSGELKEVSIDVSGAWTAESDQDWCQLTQMSGTGSQKVEVNTTYNRSDEERTAKIIIKATAKSSLNQTITITQAGNPLEEIPVHFTDVKIEDGKIWYKYWTGNGGNEVDGENSDLLISLGGIHGGIADYVYPNMEIDWKNFNRHFLSTGKGAGTLQVGNIETVNKIVVDQSQTFKEIGGATNEGSCETNFALNGKLYYGGGYSERGTNIGMPYSVPAYDFHCYDPATNSHTKLNNLPFVNGKAFVFNGTAYSVVENYSLYKYDLNTDSWSFMQNLSIPSGVVVGSYVVGTSLYVLCHQERHEFKFSEGIFNFQSTVSHDFNSPDVIIDNIRNAWVKSDGILYKHSNTGFTEIQEDVDDILGAYDGFIYYMKDENPYKLSAQGSVEMLTTLFNIILESNDSPFRGSPYTVTVDGNIYWIGGMAKNSVASYSYYSLHNFCCFSAKNYAPTSMMIVTE